MKAKKEIQSIVDLVMDMLTGIETLGRDHIETAVIEGYKVGIRKGKIQDGKWLLIYWLLGCVFGCALGAAIWL